MLIDSIFRIIRQRTPMLLRPLIQTILGRAQNSFSRPRLEALLAQAELDLAKKPWFGGDNLSAADILMSYPMESAHLRGLLSSTYPRCCNWLDQVYNHPSFKAAKIKDGKKSMVLPL